MGETLPPAGADARTAADEPPVPDTPNPHADIILLTDDSHDVGSHLPDRFPVDTHTDAGSFEADVSGSNAVAVFSTAYPERTLAPLVRHTVSESAHARILLVATDDSDLLRYALPRDEDAVLPREAGPFPALVKRLYFRAYYAATIERYYTVALAIRNREVKLPPEKSETDDRLATLTEARERLQSYMQYFRRRLRSDDLRAMSNREERLESLATRAKNSTDPVAKGLPETCPNCGLDWTVWHGRRLRNGFTSVGANTWRCTRCSTILADDDPDNYRIG